MVSVVRSTHGTPQSGTCSLLGQYVSSPSLLCVPSTLPRLSNPATMFYAVIGGKYEGVYNSWPEAADACKGQSGAVPSKFKSEAEARQYLADRQQQRLSGRTTALAQRSRAEEAQETHLPKAQPPTPAGLKRHHGEAFGHDHNLFYVGHGTMVNLSIGSDGHASAQGEGASSLALTLGPEAATAALNAPGVHEAILVAIKEAAAKHEVEFPSTLELRGLTAERLEIEAVIPAQCDADMRKSGYEWVEKIIAVANPSTRVQARSTSSNKDAPTSGAPSE